MFGVLEYLTLVSVAGIGFTGGSALHIALGAVVLSTFSFLRHINLYKRAAELGGSAVRGMVIWTLAQSLVHSLIVAAACYALGLALRYTSGI